MLQNATTFAATAPVPTKGGHHWAEFDRFHGLSYGETSEETVIPAAFDLSLQSFDMRQVRVSVASSLSSKK